MDSTCNINLCIWLRFFLYQCKIVCTLLKNNSIPLNYIGNIEVVVRQKGVRNTPLTTYKLVLGVYRLIPNRDATLPYFTTKRKSYKIRIHIHLHALLCVCVSVRHNKQSKVKWEPFCSKSRIARIYLQVLH